MISLIAFGEGQRSPFLGDHPFHFWGPSLPFLGGFSLLDFLELKIIVLLYVSLKFQSTSINVFKYSKDVESPRMGGLTPPRMERAASPQPNINDLIVCGWRSLSSILGSCPPLDVHELPLESNAAP